MTTSTASHNRSPQQPDQTKSSQMHTDPIVEEPSEVTDEVPKTY